MVEINPDYFVQNGFAIAVAVYLLYERSKFNEKLTKTLEHISTTMDLIEERLRGK